MRPVCVPVRWQPMARAQRGAQERGAGGRGCLQARMHAHSLTHFWCVTSASQGLLLCQAANPCTTIGWTWGKGGRLCSLELRA